MTCTFQSYRIRITLIFVLCKAVLLKFNNIALGLKYFAPLYGSLNHHRLKVGLRRCHRGQLGLDHHWVCAAYSDTTIRRKKLRRFELLLVRKCNMYNTYGWRRKWEYYNYTHVSRKRQEKRNMEKSNWCYHYPTDSHITKGKCIESCGTIHHRYLVNPTASSWKQHHHADLNWRNTSVEFLKAGLSLPDNNHFLPTCNDGGGGLDCRSIIPPSNNNGEYTADNFTLNVGKLLDSLPEDTRLIFRREPDLSQFSDNVTLIDYKGRTLLRGLHLYKVFCCFLRFMGRIPGVDPLVIIEKVSKSSLQHNDCTYTH